MARRPPDPPPLPAIRPPRRYATCSEILADMYYDFGTFNFDIDRERGHFLDNLRRELLDGLDFGAVAGMYDWRLYNQARLNEGNEWNPKKPRIDLIVRFTGKGNLVFEWEPTGIGHAWADRSAYRDISQTDWRKWFRQEPIGHRPSNELIFLRDFDTLVYTLKKPGSAWGGGYDRTHVVMALLVATARLFEETRQMLSNFFEVTIPDEIAMETTDLEDYRMLVTDWKIQSVAEREEREAKAAFEALPIQTGLSYEAFIDAWNHADDKRSGPPGRPDQKLTRVRRVLREKGFDVMPATLLRYQNVLQRFRPGVLPDAEAINPTSPKNVVKLRSDEEET